MDAGKTKTMILKTITMIAPVMNLVAPVDIMMIQLITTTASPALIQHLKSTQFMLMEVEIVKRLMDATTPKMIQSVHANVTKLVAPADIILAQLCTTTASPALIKQISIMNYGLMELELVKAVQWHLYSTWLHLFGSSFRCGGTHEWN
jgi:hypothetical protein